MLFTRAFGCSGNLIASGKVNWTRREASRSIRSSAVGIINPGQRRGIVPQQSQRRKHHTRGHSIFNR